ncbi:hypothetical protein QR98_0049700 [Sarcoptes scabiei]|uniref:Uncharacterized protein n=1 Tax=Sarcoptes scabiei TaxID=52283 RepID=A0A132A689_SARSC|nr:hypothetical protein QR98_0049700 [Sarcoptes scabiei]
MYCCPPATSLLSTESSRDLVAAASVGVMDGETVEPTVESGAEDPCSSARSVAEAGVMDAPDRAMLEADATEMILRLNRAPIGAELLIDTGESVNYPMWSSGRKSSLQWILLNIRLGIDNMFWTVHNGGSWVDLGSMTGD